MRGKNLFRPKKPRKEMRLLVQVPVELRASRRTFEGTGRDLTFSGIRVRYAGHLVEGERVGVMLRIPGFANEDLQFPAEVRWVEPFPHEEVAGLEFQHTPESKRKIHLVLAELQSGNLKEIERRSPTARFRVR
jgi:hypothetical protein